jgi:hypothetical protein
MFFRRRAPSIAAQKMSFPALARTPRLWYNQNEEIWPAAVRGGIKEL